MKLPGIKSENKDAVVGRMLALCESEGEKDILPEALAVLSGACGDGSIVSVVRISDRAVVATSEGEAGSALSAMVCTIDFLDRKIKHVRGEATSLAFRDGVGCVTVRPLFLGGKAAYSAVVETKKGFSELHGRPFELLALMLSHHLSLDAPVGESPLGRESAEKAAAEKNGCVAVLGFGNKMEMSMERIDLLASKIMETISCVHEAFRIGECRFAVVTNGTEFEGSRVAALLLDECAREGMDFLSAGVARVPDDARRSLFLAEGAMMRAAPGEVIVDREFSESGKRFGDERMETVSFKADQGGGEESGEEGAETGDGS